MAKVDMMNKAEVFSLLIDRVSALSEVEAIGKCGGEELPLANESDVDLFVFCDRIPDADKRRASVNGIPFGISKVRINAFEGGLWGTGDFISIDGMEVWVMYFTMEKTVSYIDEILGGNHLDKVDSYFYPTGRCATIRNIFVLLDRHGFLASMKEKLSVYPARLAEKMIRHHLSGLDDTEDFERALSRNDVLFYHFALDLSMDHFLQALFALNRTFFPSRKRTMEYIARFDKLPEDCAGRLLKVIQSGGSPDTIRQSYDLWTSLCGDLAHLANL